ncbi:MAG: hypothetical protein M1372_02520 [Patescibacteria group bacterium]|nr:hypothetical protein [Patescibacteria group bacterium]
MGIKEKIRELRERRRTEEEEAETRVEARKKEREERYARELPEAILKQRELFAELRQAGIIAMLEEMTYPLKIQLLSIPGEQGVSSNELVDELSGRSEAETDADTRRVIELLENQEWKGQIMYPRQFEDGSIRDGSIDPTLRIVIDNDTPRRSITPKFRRGPLKSVEITYSPPNHPMGREILTIKGEDITYEGSIERNNLDAIEEGIAKAFLDPSVKRPSSPDFHPHAKIDAAI